MARFLIDVIVACIIGAVLYFFYLEPLTAAGYCLLAVASYIGAFIITRCLQHLPDILEAIFD